MLPVLAVVLLIASWTQLDGYRHRGYAFHSAAMMRDAARFLRHTLPPGSVVVTDSDTDLILAYYLESHDYRIPRINPDWLDRESGGLRIIAAPVVEFRQAAQVQAAVCAALHRYSLQGPVWVAAGGFGAHASTSVSRARPFGQAISIFQTDDLTVDPAFPLLNIQPRITTGTSCDTKTP
jgi:hypothetical protein